MSGTSSYAVEGEMTIYRAAELCASLQAALKEGDGDLAIDLSAVTEIDSAGVQLLLAAGKTATAAQRLLRLAGHSPAVAEVFGVLGLDAGSLWRSPS
jgi:anti-sigma B factor antagonist